MLAGVAVFALCFIDSASARTLAGAHATGVHVDLSLDHKRPFYSLVILFTIHSTKIHVIP